MESRLLRDFLRSYFFDTNCELTMYNTLRLINEAVRVYLKVLGHLKTIKHILEGVLVNINSKGRRNHSEMRSHKQNNVDCVS